MAGRAHQPELGGARTAATKRQHRAWGYELQRLDARAILAREPNLKKVPDFGYLAPGEAMVEPVKAALTLLAGARDLGASVLSGARAKWLIEEDGRVTGAE